jgi:hypothetical protein
VIGSTGTDDFLCNHAGIGITTDAIGDDWNCHFAEHRTKASTETCGPKIFCLNLVIKSCTGSQLLPSEVKPHPATVAGSLM